MKTCPKTNKICHPNRPSAKASARLRKRYYPAHYKCKYCNSFHVTKGKPNWRNW